MATDTSGNQKVDFVWGTFPMQPDTARTGSGAVVVSAANADQNEGWSGYSVYPSTTLTKTAITKNLNNGITSSVPNNHAVVVNNWNGFPDYTPTAPYLDTVDQVAMPNVVGLDETAAGAALVAAGFVKGTVTTTGDGATIGNDGLVKTQSVAATTLTNLGTSVNLVKYSY